MVFLSSKGRHYSILGRHYTRVGLFSQSIFTFQGRTSQALSSIWDLDEEHRLVSTLMTLWESPLHWFQHLSYKFSQVYQQLDIIWEFHSPPYPDTPSPSRHHRWQVSRKKQIFMNYVLVLYFISDCAVLIKSQEIQRITMLVKGLNISKSFE